ncbi:hypothetical protein D3C76_1159900 [compost metagenome]
MVNRPLQQLGQQAAAGLLPSRQRAEQQQCMFVAGDLGVVPAVALPRGRSVRLASMARAALHHGAKRIAGGLVEAHGQPMPAAVLPCVFEYLLPKGAGGRGFGGGTEYGIRQSLKQCSDRDQGRRLIHWREPTAG